MTAADQYNTSNSWLAPPSIGRCCGSIYASALIDLLTSTASPLLAEPTTGEDRESLEPKQATTEQQESFNRFCRVVLENCADRVTRNSFRESFTFGAQDDEWSMAWGERTGIPFEQHRLRERWNALETYEPQQVPGHAPNDPLSGWAMLDPHLANPHWSGNGGSSKTGEKPRGKSGNLSPMDAFAVAEARQETISMAEAFLKTCPNDWTAGFGHRMAGALRRLIAGQAPKDVNPVAMMKFRWEAAQLADNLVAHYGLPAPNRQYCLAWDEWDKPEERESLLGKGKYWAARRFITNSPMRPIPVSPLQGWRFNRFERYLATAVALADLPLEKQERLLKSMEDFVVKERTSWVDPMAKAISRKRGIVERGRDYISKVNKRLALRSLSPRKRNPLPSTPQRERSDSQASPVSLASSVNREES